MIPISTLLVIAVLLGVSLTELAKDLARFFITIVVSFLIIALAVGLVIAVPNLLALLAGVVMFGSYGVAGVEAFNRYRRKHLPSS
jgi:hypothetical protein